MNTHIRDEHLIESSDTGDILEVYRKIISLIVGTDSVGGSCGISISNQFKTAESRYLSGPRNMNAAFLLALAGKGHPRFLEAVEFLDEMEMSPLWSNLAVLYKKGLELLPEEFSKYHVTEYESLVESALAAHKAGDYGALQEAVWHLFNPETNGILHSRQERTKTLREQRKVKVVKLNENPISDVAKEVLFTSNVLITLPSTRIGLDELDISETIKRSLDAVFKESQQFWYDHPIQIGVQPENNEVNYGLKHLSEAIRYEKNAGTIDKDSEVTCILSASVTHEGLQGVVKDYIEDEFNKAHNMSGLRVYLFTEADTAKLIHEVLIPAAERYLDPIDAATLLLKEIIGVDGMYGRHYSFLKAIAAFWQVFIDPEKKATFKIDLDEVFAQDVLVKETGQTAFRHLMTPLWGALGVDTEGRPVHLGMIAGALVNESDITESLFTPDVAFPAPPFTGDNHLFCSQVPQALSTVAEMMTKYGEGELDGEKNCIQRIHVTGGTNGILIDALRRYRPFTPTFIGRAEDQAYILSTLCAREDEPALRYVHKDGLILRHDKEAFAGESIKAAAIGKIVGDYERIIIFSKYAEQLPWSIEEIKKFIDPYTGCFVSPFPLNLALLRLCLKAASLFECGSEESGYQGLELIDIGMQKISAAMEGVFDDDIKSKYERECEGWNLYYDILDKVEAALNEGDPFARQLQHTASVLIDNTVIR